MSAVMLGGAPWAFATTAGPAQCASRYMDHPSAAGHLVCVVVHAETGEVLHGELVDGHWFRWSDAEAAVSLAAYRASAPAPAAATGPLCTDCESRPQSGRGRCQFCAAEQLAADEYELEAS